MSDNPYAATEVDEWANLPDIEVDGDCLIVRSQSVLPPRCIVTNEPVSDVPAVRRRLEWRGRTFQFVVSAKRCDLMVFVSRGNRYRLSLSKVVDLLVIGSIVAFIVTLCSGVPPSFVVPGMIAILGLAGWLSHFRIDLKVVNHVKGRFWIKGISQEFLDQLRDELPRDQTKYRETWSE